MGGGAALRTLEVLRGDYPIALHGVGLSLGRADALDERHLARLQRLVERLAPAHRLRASLRGAQSAARYLNHLLPLPYTEEALAVVGRHVDQLQERLGRQVLVENPSSYLRFRHSPIAEPEFLRRAGAADGVRPALRREQRLRERPQPRLRSCRLPRRAPRGRRGRDPPRRARGQRRRRPHRADRRSRLAGDRGGLVTLPPSAGPLRAASRPWWSGTRTFRRWPCSSPRPRGPMACGGGAERAGEGGREHAAEGEADARAA